MSDKTTIAWTSATFNPWWGCTKVSPGCDNCYAEGIAKRFHPGTWGVDGARRVFDQPKHWREPLKWNAKAERAGVRMRVFCASMADVFDKHPVAEEYRPELWTLIHKTPWLDWQLLTKRIGNVARMVPSSWMNGHWPRNAWLGASIVNQAEADRDIPKLLELLAPVQFLSCEPLLASVDLRRHLVPWNHAESRYGRRVGWVIVGGESGRGARPFDIGWARVIVAQCRDAGVPVFVKQLGARVVCNGMSGPGEHWPIGGKPLREEMDPRGQPFGSFRKYLTDAKGGDWNEWPEDLRVREFPGVA